MCVSAARWRMQYALISVNVRACRSTIQYRLSDQYRLLYPARLAASQTSLSLRHKDVTYVSLKKTKKQACVLIGTRRQSVPLLV